MADSTGNSKDTKTQELRFAPMAGEAPDADEATEKVKAAQSDADIASKEDAAAKDEDAASKDADVASKDADVASKDADVASKDAAVASKDAAVAFKDADVVSKDADVAPKDDDFSSISRAAEEILAVRLQMEDLQKQLAGADQSSGVEEMTLERAKELLRSSGTRSSLAQSEAREVSSDHGSVSSLGWRFSSLSADVPRAADRRQKLQRAARVLLRRHAHERV
ncbi:unnamed protein product [Effrenium voratum]|nr:unnamed protein product [Effrenium voratum]